MNRLFTLLLVLLSTVAFGQGEEVQMADTMRSNGKIYVVVAVILVVLAGFISYLFFLDRKITRTERQMDDSTGKRS